MFIWDVLSSREFLSLVRYDDRGFLLACAIGISLIFVSASIATRDPYIRSIIFQTNTSMYLIYVSVSGYFVHLQSLDKYSTIVLFHDTSGGIFLKSYAIIIALCCLAAVSALYRPPKFKEYGIQLPTLSNGDVLSTLVLAGTLRSVLVFGFLLLLTLMSLDLAFIEAQQSADVDSWPFDESTSFTLRFIFGYTILPIFSAFLLFRSISTIIRMISGSLQRYRPSRLNILARRYDRHTSNKRYQDQSRLD